MADVGKKAAKQLKEIIECPICMSDFTDPRVLPCIHTFCFECLKRTGEEAQMKPGDKMPCPLCRKEFIVPVDGVNGVQKNFFMENLLEFKSTLQIGSAPTVIFCDTCNVGNEGRAGEIPKASLICLECQENYCESCVKVHKLRKMSRKHQMVKIGSDDKSEVKPRFSEKCCVKHANKPLDYYCSDCKKIVCVSCFVESHKFHDCKDVTTIEEEFRQAIQKKAWLISNYGDEMVSMAKNKEKRKVSFLKEIFESENAIHRRNQQLKDLIDRDTKWLFDELSVIKSNHLKQMEIEMEEIARSCTMVKSFDAYCTEMRLKGSASDICSSVDQLLDRADGLERNLEAIIGRPHQSVEVSFLTPDLIEVSQAKSDNNCVGEIKAETTSQFENYAIVIGTSDGATITGTVLKVNLHRPNETTAQGQIPTTMQLESVAVIYRNNMYVCGVGENYDEIWKYNLSSGWMKCASFVQGRRGHSATFIDEVLYICGGFENANKGVLDSVEAYNAITNKCAVVGKLVHHVQNSGNCVPFKSSLYIFGGADKNYKALMSCVQVYNTIANTCFVLLNPIPRPCGLLRAILWETSVFLVGWNTCYIFDFQKETWQERKQFKTNVVHFGLILENGKVFVIGGGVNETDKAGKVIWKCRDDVRYVPLQNIIDDKPVEWKIHAKLPKPSLVQTCANVRLLNW